VREIKGGEREREGREGGRVEVFRMGRREGKTEGDSARE